MAKGRKTGGKDFTSENWTGNPNGRPPIPEDIREAKKLTRAEFERITQKFMTLSKEEMKAFANDPKTPALELMVLSIISKGINQGDDRRLNFFLDRFLGPVRKEVDHTTGGERFGKSLAEFIEGVVASRNDKKIDHK